MDNTRKISVLGSGWLGLPLTKYLSKKGYQAKTSTRSSVRAKQISEQGVDVCVFDIEKISESESSFLDADILIVNITSKNLQAFSELIAEIEKSSIQNVLFISSTSVYPNLNKVITEDDGLELEDSKLFQIENIFRKNKNFKTSILRLSGLIGYCRHPGNWFSTRAISQADAPVNLIHRDDCIGIIYSIISQNAWGDVYNGTADTHPSKRKFYSYAKKLLHQPIPNCLESDVLEYKIISNHKTKYILSYEMKHPDLYDIRFD